MGRFRKRSEQDTSSEEGMRAPDILLEGGMVNPRVQVIFRNASVRQPPHRSWYMFAILVIYYFCTLPAFILRYDYFFGACDIPALYKGITSNKTMSYILCFVFNVYFWASTICIMADVAFHYWFYRMKGPFRPTQATDFIFMKKFNIGFLTYGVVIYALVLYAHFFSESLAPLDDTEDVNCPHKFLNLLWFPVSRAWSIVLLRNYLKESGKLAYIPL